jgi:serine/threonine-protein kinase
VYALGCVLYEITLGRRPFQGDEVQIITQALVLDPPRPSALSPGYPPALEAIVVRAMSKSPAQRFATADAMRAALDEFLAASGPPIGAEAIGACVRERHGERIEARRAQIHAASVAEARAPVLSSIDATATVSGVNATRSVVTSSEPRTLPLPGRTASAAPPPRLVAPPPAQAPPGLPPPRP